jgi:hypothetical protein
VLLKHACRQPEHHVAQQPARRMLMDRHPVRQAATEGPNFPKKKIKAKMAAGGSR